MGQGTGGQRTIKEYNNIKWGVSKLFYLSAVITAATSYMTVSNLLCRTTTDISFKDKKNFINSPQLEQNPMNKCILTNPNSRHL